MSNNPDNEKIVITNQNITYRRFKSDFVFKGSEIRQKIQAENHKDDYDPIKQEYSFTNDEEIDTLLNSVIKEDSKVFNSMNGNYRQEMFSPIGYFDIFKIKGTEYFVKHKLDDEGEMLLTVYNYEYTSRWLKYLCDLKQNYKIYIPLDLEEQFLNEAPSEIDKNNIKELASFIHNIFLYCIQYHHRPFFEKSHNKREVLNMLITLWSWKHHIDDCVRENRNGVIIKLSELFLRIPPYEFLLIRDYTIFSIDKYINLISQYRFQWGYNPYFDDLISLLKAIKKNHSDKKINLKNEIKKSFTPIKKVSVKSKEKFNQKQIAIAYFFRKGKTITTENYKEILELHSETYSDKILQKRVISVKELTELNGNKTSDTKHLRNLEGAKRLLTGVKDNEAIKALDTVISAFKSNYNAFY